MPEKGHFIATNLPLSDDSMELRSSPGVATLTSEASPATYPASHRRAKLPTEKDTLLGGIIGAGSAVAGYLRVSQAREGMAAQDIYRKDIGAYCGFRGLVLSEIFLNINYSGRRGADHGPVSRSSSREDTNSPP
jgi:hypothetical protein